MATLRDIRRRINSVKSTQQITKAMKMVAAAKLRRAQEQINRLRPYADGLTLMLEHVAAKVEHQLNPYLQEREVHRIGYIVVTADRGLCGSFNANILRRAKREVDAQIEAGQQVELITIGKKGFDFFRHREYAINFKLTNLFNRLEYSHALEIANDTREKFLQGYFDQIFIVHAEALSPVKQNVVVEQYLPIVAVPPEEKIYHFEYMFEPSPEQLLQELCPKSLNIRIWRALLESFFAEQGARMVAMESATDNAQEMIYHLTLYYNKVRQATITKEISEIVGGAEALK
ncbi:MAG: ATP synthase F1 subunit gamma [Calditrichaeota bacterium]|nr:MAG: ATP synthase F1 subunit gamma [Calditrichota bacterium]